MNIYSKLANIQRELFVPKGQRNDFGKYNYRSCEDILQAVKPICEANGCVLYLTNELVNIGNRNYVKAIATLADLESEEALTSEAHACEEETKKGMDGSQITGAASSYARKYALAGLFAIDNEKDSDATNESTEGNNKTKTPAKTPTKAVQENKPTTIGTAKVNMLKSRIAKAEIDVNTVCALYKHTKLEEFTENQFVNACDNWDKVVEKCKQN